MLATLLHPKAQILLVSANGQTCSGNPRHSRQPDWAPTSTTYPRNHRRPLPSLRGARVSSAFTPKLSQVFGKIVQDRAARGTDELPQLRWPRSRRTAGLGKPRPRRHHPPFTRCRSHPPSDTEDMAPPATSLEPPLPRIARHNCAPGHIHLLGSASSGVAIPHPSRYQIRPILTLPHTPDC